MTEIRTKDLTYGHFGQPTYDTESQQWHFPRQVSIDGHIESLGDIKTIISDSTQDDIKANLSSVEKIKGLHQAAGYHPEVQPAFDAILGHVRDPAVADHPPLSYDVSKSDLLAFGTATSAKASRHTARVPIVAFPGGSAGELVTLLTLQNEQLSWERTSPVSINRLTAAGGIRGWWSGSGSPVQQIVSAVNVDADSPGLFAVRHHKAVSILQPRLHGNLRFNRMKLCESYLLPPSRLLPQEIASIGGNDVRAVPFSDVAFNPWFSEQLATLGQNGVWHVWDLELKSKAKGLWTLNSVDTGSLPSARSDSDLLEPYDCWGRVLWVKDLQTLLLAQRRQLSLVRIGGKLDTAGIPDLGLTHSADWILEVKRSPANPAHFFVVTSTRVIWLAVLPMDEMRYDDGASVNVTILLSWVHYRNPEDLSLGLETCHNECDGRDTTLTYLLLYSRLKHFMTVYTFELSGSNGHQGQSVCDPYILTTSRPSPDEDGSQHEKGEATTSLSSLILRNMGYMGNASPLGVSGLAGSYQEQGIEFYQAAMLDAQYRLSECLCFRKPIGCTEEVTEPTRKSRHGISKTPTRIEENFIVPDATVYEAMLDDLEDQDQDDLPLRLLPDSEEERAKTLDFRWLAESLAHNAVSSQGKLSDLSSSVEAAIDRIISHTEAAELLSPSGLMTLSEMAGNDVSISDIDSAGKRLANLLRQSTGQESDQVSDHGESRPGLVPLPITPALRLEVGLPLEEGFRALYETLIKAHITPMTKTIPGRARVTIERRIRSIAATLLLATFTTEKPSGSDESTLENGPAETPERPPFDLPVRKKVRVSQPAAARGTGKPSIEPTAIASNSSRLLGEEASSSLQTSLALQTAAPSSAERSDASTAPAPQRTTHRPLRSLVSFSAQPALPTKLTETLQHWTVGADPNLFDWAATQNAPTSQTEAETEEQSEPSSSRRRKAKRQKLSKPTNLDTASGPRPPVPLQNVTSASQPGPVVRLTESQPTQIASGGGSQLTMATQESQGQTMSQLVDGRYGNRRLKPKGLKKRKEGF